MPFELGLTVMAAYDDPKQHTWCLFEKSYPRLMKSLSDLGGTDVYCHGGRPIGVLSQIGNALVREEPRAPSIKELRAVHRDLMIVLPKIVQETGAGSCYEARVFKDLVYAARSAVGKRLGAGVSAKRSR
jgi:hypothetical protein